LAERDESVNRQVNSIAGRMSLRAPQRESLEILDRITEIVPLTKTPDVAAALAAIKSEFPKATDFEREFIARGVPILRAAYERRAS